MKSLFVIILLCLSLTAWAVRPLGTDTLKVTRLINRTTSFGVGYTNVYDTYLSPQEYKGIDFRFSRESMRMTNLLGGHTSLQNFFQADLGYTHNRAENNNTLSSLFNWNLGLHYQFHITDNFKLLAGALADMNLGFVYNMRNGNNPVSARAYANIDASGMAIWHLHVKNYPLILRYQLNIPLVGGMFSPEYGESYYEIFVEGNGHNVVHFTSLHNNPSLRQILSVDLPLGSVKLRLSYIGDFQQSKLSGIDTHTYSHVFMVGVSKDLYRIHPKEMLQLPNAVRAY